LSTANFLSDNKQTTIVLFSFVMGKLSVLLSPKIVPKKQEDRINQVPGTIETENLMARTVFIAKGENLARTVFIAKGALLLLMQ